MGSRKGDVSPLCRRVAQRSAQDPPRFSPNRADTSFREAFSDDWPERNLAVRDLKSCFGSVGSRKRWVISGIRAGLRVFPSYSSYSEVAQPRKYGGSAATRKSSRPLRTAFWEFLRCVC